MKRKFDAALLSGIAERDGFTLLEETAHLNRNAQVACTCKCGATFVKTFRWMVRNGGFCNSCITTLSQKRRTTTCREKYGCDHPMQSENVKDKIKETCREKYGCDYPVQSDNVKEKSKETCREKYGCDYAAQNDNVKDKGKETCRAKYGCDFPLQSENVKEKKKETCREKYGCDNPMHNGTVAEAAMKNSHCTKEYTFACGAVRRVQGYEPFALRDLEEQGYTAAELETERTSVPMVWWTDDSGTRHRYFVDIYIPSEKRMIEVKSDYTYASSGVQEKARASLAAGFAYEFWVYGSDGARRVVQNNTAAPGQ